MATQVKGVLFDSGGVLMGPRGGRWWPIWGFEELVLAHEPNASFESLADAVEEALPLLDGTDDELRAFYRALLEELDLPPSEPLVDAILAIRPEDAVDLFDD